VRSDGARWRVMSEDVVTTRALEVVTL